MESWRAGRRQKPVSPAGNASGTAAGSSPGPPSAFSMDSWDRFIRSFRSRKVASTSIRWRSILRFPGVRRDPAPPWTPHPDRPLSGPAESPETSDESPDAGEGRRSPAPPPGPARTPGTPHGPVAHRPKPLDGPPVMPVGYRLPTPRGWPAPDGGRPKQEPKAPRLGVLQNAHISGLSGLGAFHLGGASASSRPAGGLPDSLVRHLGLPPSSSPPPPSDEGNGPPGPLARSRPLERLCFGRPRGLAETVASGYSCPSGTSWGWDFLSPFYLP